MRIANAHLEGYLGILEGTSRNDVYVNFEPAFENGYSRILSFGRNGCGKTTFMNAMTPFASQGDDRDVIIVPGRPGRKVLTFINGIKEVKIDIRWSSKGKTSYFMFIDGDDKPLDITAKGNLGEYHTAVLEHLGVTPEYLKIGRIGGRVSGFLEMKPGPRKNYIGRFMPEVEEWSVMHKNVAKRISIIKNEIKGLQVELERIADREELEGQFRVATTTLKSLRDQLSDVTASIGAHSNVVEEMRLQRENIISRVAPELTVSEEFNPFQAIIGTATKNLKTADQRIEHMLKERPRLAAFNNLETAKEKLQQISLTIAEVKGELSSLRNIRSTQRAQLDSAIVAENNAKNSLERAISSENSLKNLSVQREDLLKKKTDIETKIAEKNMEVIPEDIRYEEVKQASDTIMGLISEFIDLSSMYPNPEMFDLALRNNMDSESLLAMSAVEKNKVRELRSKVDTLKARSTTISAQASFYKRFSGMHCNDSRCPFENHISQFATADEELDSKNREIALVEERINNSQIMEADLRSTAAAAKSTIALYNRIRKLRPVLEMAGVWHAVATIDAFTKLIGKSTIAIEQAISVTHLLERVEIFRQLSETNSSLLSVEERISSLESLRNAADMLRENVANATQARIQLEEFYTKADTDAVEGEKKLKLQEQAFELINQFTQNLELAKTAREKIDSLLETNAELEEINTRWTTATTELQAVSATKKNLETTISSAEGTLANVQLRLSRRDEFEARIAGLQGRLEKAESVALTCHPAKGAPLEFLRDFLDTTRENTNELLDVAMRGEFRIGFNLTESEFQIPVAKGSGRVMSDITEASEGQLALAKTVLSLALVKQTLQVQGGYNIVCLDEIDGPLDRERNRERFAEIIDRLTEELSIEQLMMISHNDNFAAAPAGIILFPGHSMPVDDPNFTSNKLILADFS